MPRPLTLDLVRALTRALVRTFDEENQGLPPDTYNVVHGEDNVVHGEDNVVHTVG